MPRKKLSLSDQLRAAVIKADESQYRIAKDTGIDQSLLSRFVNKKSSLSLRYVDALAEYLGLVVAYQDKDA
ncbi:MAG: helix-turn-helix transcriptional regulator [Planctomycetota bacterium]